MNNQLNRKKVKAIRRIGTLPIPLLILFTLPGWIIAWATNLSVVADIAAIIAASMMFVRLWKLIGHPEEMIRLLRIGALLLCALQNVTWLTASGLHRFVLHIPIEKTMSRLGNGSFYISDYVMAFIFITLFASCIAYFGSVKVLSKLEQQVAAMLTKLIERPTKKIVAFLSVILVLELFMIASGTIGQRSMVVEGAAEGERNLLTSVFGMLLPSQLLFNAILISKLLEAKNFFKNKMFWAVFIASMITVLFLYFNKGRSGLFFSLLAFGYWLAFFNRARPKFWKLALTCAIIYPILSQVLLFSNFIRSANAGIDDWKGSAIEVVPRAWQKFKSSADMIEQEKARTASNLSTRPLVATPLARAIKLPMEQKSFMMGENLRNAAIWVIPGPLFPNKKDYPTQEELLYKHFPLGDVDTADSLYLSSYSEFGWVGIAAYPLILLIMWIWVMKIVLSIGRLPMFGVICVGVFFQLFLLNIGEGAVNTWLIGLRSCIFIFLVARIWILFIMPKQTRKHRLIFYIPSAEL